MRYLEALIVIVASITQGSAGTHSGVSPAFEDALRQEFRAVFTEGRLGPLLDTISQELDLQNWLQKDQAESKLVAGKVNLLCTACVIGVEEIIHLVLNGTDASIITAALKSLCVDMGFSDHTLCDSFIDIAEPQLLWIIMNTAGLTGNDVCGTMFVIYGCDSRNPDRIWEVQMPDVPKPPIGEPTEPVDLPTLKVLHLADTHYDPNYLPGSNANCPEKYFCCNADSGDVLAPEDAAGYWGDYRNCDAPKWLLETMYDFIADNNPDIDFIIWTGDLVPHAIWNTSKEENIKIIRSSVELVMEKFPGVPVFPALGNHESHPVNTYPQPYIDNEFDISWLYDEMKTLWMNWLDEDVAESVAYGGYYATMIRPKLKVISVNTNYCYGFNWWLVHDSTDPASGLEWMANELQKSEDADEKVYIISHICPGDSDCSKTWSHQYSRIVARYEGTISGLFYGHTHKDHFVLFFDPEDSSRVTNIGYVGQSQTPFHGLNPGFKLYTIAAEFGEDQQSTFRVVDHDNWILDLDEANNGTEPVFHKLYSAKEEYGLDILTPSTWLDLVHRMAQPDSEEFTKFFRNFYKAGRPYMEAGCDDTCKTLMLCNLVTADTSDSSHCEQIFN